MLNHLGKTVILTILLVGLSSCTSQNRSSVLGREKRQASNDEYDECEELSCDVDADCDCTGYVCRVGYCVALTTAQECDNELCEAESDCSVCPGYTCSNGFCTERRQTHGRQECDNQYCNAESDCSVCPGYTCSRGFCTPRKHIHGRQGGNSGHRSRSRPPNCNDIPCDVDFNCNLCGPDYGCSRDGICVPVTQRNDDECGRYGEDCDQLDNKCCAGLFCEDAVCAAKPLRSQSRYGGRQEEPCSPRGGECRIGLACCEESAGVTCYEGRCLAIADHGYGGRQEEPCSPRGEACRIGLPCCAGFTCYEGRCIDQPMPGPIGVHGYPSRQDEPCSPRGEACRIGLSCCEESAGVTCYEGRCVDQPIPHQGAGIGLGIHCSGEGMGCQGRPCCNGFACRQDTMTCHPNPNRYGHPFQRGPCEAVTDENGVRKCRCNSSSLCGGGTSGCRCNYRQEDDKCSVICD